MPQDYSGRNLRGRNFRGQNLEGANFSGADICGVDFSEAILRGAKFRNINKNVDTELFKSQKLTNANFSGADIRSVDFTGANITRANFSHAQAGLQQHQAINLLIISWLLSGVFGGFLGLSGFFVGRLFNVTIFESISAGVVSLIIIPVFFTFTIRKGLIVGLQSVAVAVAISVGLAVVITTTLFTTGFLSFDTVVTVAQAVTIAGSIAGIVTGIVTGVVTIAIVVAKSTFGVVAEFVSVVIAGTIAIVGAFISAKIGLETRDVTTTVPGIIAATVPGTIAANGCFVSMLLMAYIGRCAFAEDSKYTFIREMAISFAATRGTSFYNAKLTDASFTKAKLKNTDFRNATLTRTYFQQTEMLYFANLEETYLKNPKVRRLIVEGNGQNQNFDDEDFRGINLQGANLKYASFIDVDLTQANLQEANLFEAKLVRTNLDLANLSNSCLTGAYIEDWGITRRTKLAFIECEYVYLKLPTEGDRDPNRMPPLGQGNFEANDFSIFITSVLDTLDLYHKQEINSSVAITVLKGMTQKYPVQFEMVGLENRGNRQFVIRLKVHGQMSYSQLQKEYYSKYEQTLPMYDPKGLLPDTDAYVAQVIEAVNENPSIQILNEQGIVFAGGEVRMNLDQSRT